MSHGDVPVRAAGPVGWRDGDHGPRVAVVHRPRYDDWSLPKGKLERGEHPMEAAVREIREEIGQEIVLGPPLPGRDYLVDGVPKHVDFWSARALGGTFEADDEVDGLEWLTPDKARARLTHPGDAVVLDAFEALPRRTVPTVVLRHAKALSRSEWSRPDPERPLTDKGHEHAERIGHVLLTAYPVLRVVTSPWLRCAQTVVPYATLADTPVHEERLLGEEEFEDEHAKALAAVDDLLDTLEPLLLCSHGNVTADLAERAALASRKGVRLPAEPLAKGAFVVVHRDLKGRAVAAEVHRP
jgi:8-oxo-(d)GTP phosphatase